MKTWTIYRATIPPFLKTLMLTVTPFSQEETTLSSENDALGREIKQYLDF